MARFSGGSGSGSGAPGPRGPVGPAGDSAYEVAVANGFVGTEQEWLDSIGSADIADFAFNYNAEATDSTMTIHNHDMVIKTTRDANQDADINIDSADDVFINAQDEIEIISKTDDVTIITNEDVNSQQWRFHTDGTLTGPAEGNSVKVNGIQGQDNSPLYLIGPQSVVISGDGGEFLHNADGPENQIATIGDINEALPQPLGETDSPSFDKVFVTNNDGSGMNVKFGDDAWIGDVNQANNIAVIGVQDPTVGGIIFGNGLTEKIVSDVNGNLQLFMDGTAYIGNVDSGNRIATMSDVTGGTADLVVPTSIKDEDDADFITFTRTGTGTARIATPQDDLSLRSARDITLIAGDDGPGNVYIGWGDATITPNAENRVATIGDIQNMLPSISPLPDFLTYVEGRAALPTLNQNFGWDARGLWFGPTALDSESNESYPVFTDFTLNTTDKVFVSFLVDVDENCSDVGICVFPNGTVPNWTWGTDTTRIAAQFDCPNSVIHGLTISSSQPTPSLPGNGTYRIEFTYDPTLEADNVKLEYFELNNNVAIGSQTLTEILPPGSYRIGFASDNDISEEGGPDSPLNRTYISDLFISVNNDQTTYSNTLQNGNSGGFAYIADFVFDFVQGEGTESRMTIHNHDMRIRTTRDDNQDADISIDSADDVWIIANDTVEITSVTDEVRIITGEFGQKQWNFRQDGVIGIDGNTGIEVTDDGDIKGRLKFEPNNGRALLEAYGSTQTATFTDSWDTATWTTSDPQLSQLTLTNASSIISFMDATGHQVNNLKISVNGSDYGIYNGYSSGDGAITFYIQNLLPLGEVNVTEVRFQYAFSSKVDIDFDEGDLLIETKDEMDIVIDSADDLYLRASGDDIFIQANNDINFTANNGSEDQNWRMDINGQFQFPAAGYIENPFGNSSDGNQNDTFRIVPDADLQTDQYLIIEPTQAPDPMAPGHIHIRAGGSIDESTADLILGGERTHVQISDENGSVKVSSKILPTSVTHQNIETEASGSLYISGTGVDIELGDYFDANYWNGSETVVGRFEVVNILEQDGNTVVTAGIAGTGQTYSFEPLLSYTFYRDNTGENHWRFDSDGTLYGPVDGNEGIKVIAIHTDYDLPLVATDSVILHSQNGEYLNHVSPENQIATIGDIEQSTPVETSFAVNGGTLGTQPTFNGAPLFTGSYVKHGPMVHFQIQVDMDNITSFGTGQYFVDLPFPAKYGYQVTEGCLHDASTGKQYAMGGHVYAGESRLVLSFTDTNGQDAPFDFNSPVTLTTEDNFHIAGTYITV